MANVGLDVDVLRRADDALVARTTIRNATTREYVMMDMSRDAVLAWRKVFAEAAAAMEVFEVADEQA